MFFFAIQTLAACRRLQFFATVLERKEVLNETLWKIG